MANARSHAADVVVAGCGPAGATLAYLLARSGVDVTLVEREQTFTREYRGFGWNPGVLRLFDEMGVLEDVLDLAHETAAEGTVDVYGRRVTVLDFERLDTAHPFLVLMEQPALLEYLVDRAREYDSFDFHPATTVTGVRTDGDGGVVGLDAHDRNRDETVAYDARCVVGADGRYSVVRHGLGIEDGRFDSPLTLVWFKLTSDVPVESAQGRVRRAGIVLYFGLGTGELQIGYVIRDGAWPAIKAAGVADLRRRIAAVDPRLAPALAAELDAVDDCTLLDVAPGLAPTWVRDGVALVGDAAHTASPIGAQGNPLAIEDVVTLHPLLVDAIETPGPVRVADLAPYERRRRPHVESIITRQHVLAERIATLLRYTSLVPAPVGRVVARPLDRLLPYSNRLQSLTESFVLGDESVSVARDRFVD